VRVLEVQEHLHRRVLPDQTTRLDEDPVAGAQIADKRIARCVQQQQARNALGDEPVDKPANRVMPLGVVAVASRVPDVGVVPLISDVACRHEKLVFHDVDRLIRLEREREDLAGMIGAEGDESWALRLHHDQRHAGHDPVPAPFHPH